MNAKDEGQQCEHEWNWDRSRCFKCLLELSDYVYALQQQVTELEGKAALGDEMQALLVARYQETGAMFIDEIADWLTRYDALTSPSTIAQKEMVQ